MMPKFEDLTKQRFGRLTVIERAEDYVSPKGKHMRRWLCRCDCGNERSIIEGSLKSSKTVSCGCYHIQVVTRRLQNCNSWKIDMNTNTATGIDIKGAEFIIDAEDWVKCKDYYWTRKHNCYYVVSPILGNLHRFLLNPPDNLVVDHINGNPLDNRKCNLRICTIQQNGMNRKVASNNNSGCTGVSKVKRYNKWQANIGYKGKSYYLGLYDTKEEAIKARKEAEKKYFGEYARAE